MADEKLGDSPNLLRYGVIGGVIAAIRCFTRPLVIALGAAGLAAWLGWLDYGPLPTLVVFLGFTAQFFVRHNEIL